jgi:uncharacterized protein
VERKQALRVEPRHSVTQRTLEAAVIGGAILGGGGGGHAQDAYELGALALEIGPPAIVDACDLPDDALLFTVGLVGAPAAPDRWVKPADYVRAVELLTQHVGRTPAGLISNENGPVATINGWLQSARLGIPVVDAPCNGRAHPLSARGAMGLHRLPRYVASAAAVGGNPQTQRHVEIVEDGSVEHVARVLREAAVEAGGFVAIARNPTTASYVRGHAAVGALSHAIQLGSKVVAAREIGPREMIEVAAHTLQGCTTELGIVTHASRSTRDGYDIGDVVIETSHDRYALKYCNEYLTLDHNEQRLASFPDLITIFWIETGLPVASADVAKGMEVGVLWTAAHNLILGAGMRDPALHVALEQLVGEPLGCGG